MAVKNGGNALSQLRTLFNVGAIGSLSDGQLLERFATGRGEPRELAFASLVERHGPLVLRVCRSVLRDKDAAEDAFQATFLALARKAGSLWTRDSLAPWLHQVAYRAAIHDRAATIRRRSRENAAAAVRPESVAAPHYNDDLEQIIHEEIDRLPGCFRVAVVLCDLEGRTHEQAARHLGCAVGTVKSRLARGRKRLRGRLERRGAAPALALAPASARAAVPTGLARATVIHAATAGTVPASVAVITGGVLMSMIVNKVKFVMAAAAVAAALAVGVVALRSAKLVGPPGQERPKVVLTGPRTMDVTVTLRYVCQLHAGRYIDIRALVAGYLSEIDVKEGQAVKKGDLMFKIVPVLSRSKLDAEKAEADLAQLEYDNIKTQRPNAPQNEVALAEAKLAKANARRELAKAELNFANIAAPFDGIVGRLQLQPGAMVKEGDILTTLSDISVMYVYYRISENDYIDYLINQEQTKLDKFELVLADQTRYPHPGKFGAFEAQIGNPTGDIPCRADFPNPDGLLRHDQTGTILIHRKLHDAIVVPQRATFEIMDKRYVYIVNKDNVVHRREIVVQNEMDDIYVIKKGVDAGDRIILEGIRQVRDGEKVEYEFRPPEGVMAGMHIRAE